MCSKEATLLLAVCLACLMLSTAVAVELQVLVFGNDLVLETPPAGAENSTKPEDNGAIRRRKQATTYDVEPALHIEDKLNQLRRTVSSSNMNYVNWNSDLEQFASGLVNQCHLQTEAVIDGSRFPYVRGFTGIFRRPYSVAAQLQSAYNYGSSESYYRQLMSSRMVEFGCSVSAMECAYYDKSHPMMGLQFGKIFACIFSYRSDPEASVLYKSGVNCSSCDNQTLWCDGGLCRNKCFWDDNCVDCVSACSDCDQVTTGFPCRCVCYYGDDSTARCQSNAYSSSANPICSAGETPDESHLGRMPVGWIACIIISSALLLSLVVSIAIWQCVRNRYCCVSRQGHRQTSPSTAGQDNVASNVYEEFGPGFIPVLSPPPYTDTSVKPPPYDISALPPVQKGPHEPPAPSYTYDNPAFPAENSNA